MKTPTYCSSQGWLWAHWHAEILPVAGVVKHTLYRKESTLLQYGFITNCFQSPTHCCVRAGQVTACRFLDIYTNTFSLTLLIFTDFRLRYCIFHCGYIWGLQISLKHPCTKPSSVWNCMCPQDWPLICTKGVPVLSLTVVLYGLGCLFHFSFLLMKLKQYCSYICFQMPLKCLLVLLISSWCLWSGNTTALQTQPHISLPPEHTVSAALLAFKAVLNLAFDSLC